MSILHKKSYFHRRDPQLVGSEITRWSRVYCYFSIIFNCLLKNICYSSVFHTYILHVSVSWCITMCVVFILTRARILYTLIIVDGFLCLSLRWYRSFSCLWSMLDCFYALTYRRDAWMSLQRRERKRKKGNSNTSFDNFSVAVQMKRSNYNKALVKVSVSKKWIPCYTD